MSPGNSESDRAKVSAQQPPRGGPFTVRLTPCVQWVGRNLIGGSGNVEFAFLMKAPTPEGADVHEPPASCGYSRFPIAVGGHGHLTVISLTEVSWFVPPDCLTPTHAAAFLNGMLTHYGRLFRSPGHRNHVMLLTVGSIQIASERRN